jgi:hypothetical protein
MSIIFLFYLLTSFQLNSIHSIVICIESCLFGIFVVTVFIDQIQSIITDRSLIDTLKLDENSRMEQQILPPRRVLFGKVFGPGNQTKIYSSKFLFVVFLGPMILWLCPCDLKKSNQTLDLPDMYNV